MPFGKYKGRYLVDLPEPYLVWFRQKGFPEGKMGLLLQEMYEIKVNGLEKITSSAYSKIKMKQEIRVTSDGSKTIFVVELDETYHSVHGAVQESRHVFIEHGFHLIKDKKTLSILEIGFGTGLNTFLTLIESAKFDIKVDYVGLEAFPIEKELVEALNYAKEIDLAIFENEFFQLHEQKWNEKQSITSTFSLLKIHEQVERYSPPKNSFDVIYFDAFSPNCQAEMWEIAIFEKLFSSLKKESVLVTYCAKGKVKRDLKSVGFRIVSFPGPPGKREMTVAYKDC